jgi:S1-C subfamily serine protease
VAGVLALLAPVVAVAQQAPGVFAYKWNAAIPADMIVRTDIVQGLIWTGYLGVRDGGGDAAIRKATQAWQAAKKRPLTESLPDDQAVELVSEGLKRRDDVGWAILRDDSVGFTVGIPTKLAKLATPQADGSFLNYQADGVVSQSISVKYGTPNCATMNTFYAAAVSKSDTYHAKTGDGFVIMTTAAGGSQTLGRAVCHSVGVVMALITVPTDRADLATSLFTATMASVSISRNFNPSARPRPRVEEPPPAPMEAADGQVARPRSTDTAPKNVDTAGVTDRLKLVRRHGNDLRAEEVFEKVGGAVYMVKADKKIGSAVAVSESDLLTNCHVVGDKTQVLLVRDKLELKATVVSMNVNADRCVLRTETKLPKWVGVRPYSDIKVGERALTIGTPAGLELTVAEGIVSSKRSQNDSKLVQTTAPISQGSSGGGLFDAQGELLGITTFYFKGGQNLNFAVAAEEFARPDGQPD